ncbi:hypothetical protein LshimejAT787_0602060 [Lyophyllum shimeji]|uniref:Uncharacterized protein n=1 Tax=Lyophyllum shimeji TaxID=47721 RepID=A0A9P3PPB0_LYOSH|nr:hypothetical protein LshimejAT787_0602060 [Lyophyllum shimeji]
MSPDGNGDSSSQSTWHSIRPWSPPLALTVREVTSVSVTFILSSHVTDVHGDLEPLAALGLNAAEDEGEKEQAEDGDSSQSLEPKKKSIISDALAKGLSVDVNGSPWQRVFIRIEDGADEAVIIIYGLMPGREYDVKLGLVQGDSNGTIRQQVMTEEIELEPSEVQTDPESPDPDRSTSSDPPPSTPSTSPNRTLPNTPPSTTSPFTIEDRLIQLQNTLALINTERETLTASLKSARRDAQKADAALRSEIEILKRASEKHVAADHRARQKILSLQEAIKRAQTATRETEELVKEVEEQVPELNRQREEKEAEYAKIKEQADRVRKLRDEQTEKEKKKLESMRGELTGLTTKMEKLNAKKEKLENGTITDLEQQLKDVELEIEQAERDAEALNHQSFVNQQEFLAEDLHCPEVIGERSPAFPYLPVQRIRPQLPHSPGTIGRPVHPAPIQRPTPSEPHYGQQPALWNTSPRQSQASQAHAPRASSLQHQQTPILLMNPHRHSSLKSTTSPPANCTTSSSSSQNASPPAMSTTTTTSTLSSRAPAFEPGRTRKNSNIATGTSSGFSVSSTPIQRPNVGGARGFGFGAHPKSKSNSQQAPWAGFRSPYDDGRG